MIKDLLLNRYLIFNILLDYFIKIILIANILIKT